MSHQLRLPVWYACVALTIEADCEAEYELLPAVWWITTPFGRLRRSGCRTNRRCWHPRGAGDDLGLRNACRGAAASRPRVTSAAGSMVESSTPSACAPAVEMTRTAAPSASSTQWARFRGCPVLRARCRARSSRSTHRPVRHLPGRGCLPAPRPSYQVTPSIANFSRSALGSSATTVCRETPRRRRDRTGPVGLVVVDLSNRRGRDAIDAFERRRADSPTVAGVPAVSSS